LFLATKRVFHEAVFTPKPIARVAPIVAIDNGVRLGRHAAPVFG